MSEKQKEPGKKKGTPGRKKFVPTDGPRLDFVGARRFSSEMLYLAFICRLRRSGGLAYLPMGYRLGPSRARGLAGDFRRALDFFIW